MSTKLRSDLAALRVTAEKRRRSWQYYANLFRPVAVPETEWVERVKTSSDLLTKKVDAAATRVLQLINELDEQCQTKETAVDPFTKQRATAALSEAEAEIRDLELSDVLHAGYPWQLVDWYTEAAEKNETDTSELATVEHHIALLALISSKLRSNVPLNVRPNDAVPLRFGVLSRADLKELRKTSLDTIGVDTRFLNLLEEWTGFSEHKYDAGSSICIKTEAGVVDLEALPSLEATWAHVVKMAAYHPTLGKASS